MLQMVLLTVLVALTVSLLLVPIVRAVFLRIGLIDKPDAVRKLQKQAIALGGGLAIFCSVCVTFAAIVLWDRYDGEGLLGTLGGQWRVLFGAAGCLMLVGLVDDAFSLRGRQKLLLQILIVVAVVGSGTVVNAIGLFGYDIQLGVLAFPLTVVWLLASINALNLIDGADGMASTAGAVISGGLAIMCLQTGSPLGAVVAAAVCGSLLGFLFFNRPPATIYLGDAGSMTIGLFIGVLAIWGSIKGSTVFSVAPLLALSVPLFDSVIAILRRVLTGRSIYATDRAHLHHRLLDKFSHQSMLGVVALMCATTSAAAIVALQTGHQWVSAAGAMVVLGGLVLTKTFGSAELRMLASRTTHFGQSLLVRNSQSDVAVHQKCVHLQGCRRWDAIWRSLIDFAETRNLSKIKLDLSISWMQEGYHGSWRRSRLPERFNQVALRVPIVVNTHVVGTLEAMGDAEQPGFLDAFEQLIERIRDLTPEVQYLISTPHLAELEFRSAFDSQAHPAGLDPVGVGHSGNDLGAPQGPLVPAFSQAVSPSVR